MSFPQTTPVAHAASVRVQLGKQRTHEEFQAEGLNTTVVFQRCFNAWKPEKNVAKVTHNFYAEHIMRNAGLNEAQAGIKIAGRNINNLRYAYDTTLMAENEE